MTNKPTATCPSGEPCLLNTELDALKQEIGRLSELVSSDPLTTLFNYRHFCHVLSQETERSQRTQQPTTLIMVDIDHFKQVNDQWGHEVGNQALKLIAKCLLNTIRKLDIVCRYGGEEFAVILPSTDIITGAQVAERIRQSIENTPLEFTHTGENNTNTQKTIHLTASAGLSTYKGNSGEAPNLLVEKADQQLYQAKMQGRNQVCYIAPDTAKQQVSSEEKSALFDMYTPPDT